MCVLLMAHWSIVIASYCVDEIFPHAHVMRCDIAVIVVYSHRCYQEETIEKRISNFPIRR